MQKSEKRLTLRFSQSGCRPFPAKFPGWRLRGMMVVKPDIEFDVPVFVAGTAQQPIFQVSDDG